MSDPFALFQPAVLALFTPAEGSATPRWPWRRVLVQLRKPTGSFLSPLATIPLYLRSFPSGDFFFLAANLPYSLSPCSRAQLPDRLARLRRCVSLPLAALLQLPFLLSVELDVPLLFLTGQVLQVFWVPAAVFTACSPFVNSFPLTGCSSLHLSPGRAFPLVPRNPFGCGTGWFCRQGKPFPSFMFSLSWPTPRDSRWPT